MILIFVLFAVALAFFLYPKPCLRSGVTFDTYTSCTCIGYERFKEEIIEIDSEMEMFKDDIYKIHRTSVCYGARVSKRSSVISAW